MDNNTYAIYQVKDGDAYRHLRFNPSSVLKGNPVPRDAYDLVYTGMLDKRSDRPVEAILEDLFYKFNVHHPADFTGRSSSTSDVIVLNQDGRIACYYVEPIGFRKLEGFLEQENHLKNAEMAMEDDYDMIDGIINNGSKESVRQVLNESQAEVHSHIPTRQKIDHHDLER